MYTYDYEKKNKNFISGDKFCIDIPFQCDCGIEKTLPEDSEVDGVKVCICYNVFTL